MLTGILVAIVATGLATEIIRYCGVKKGKDNVVFENTNQIIDTAVYLKKNDLSPGEWDTYKESVKTMISAAMKRINDRNLVCRRFWKDLTKEEKIIIRHSQKYAVGLDRLSKNLVDIRYPNEAKYLMYDKQLKEIAQGPNPSIAELRKQLPKFYLSYLREDVQ